MSEAWKKQDRACPPCPDCGTELYEKFWGNGGWMPTEKATERAHGPSACVPKLRLRVIELEAQLLDSAQAIQEGIALASQLGKDGAERERKKYLLGYSDGHREALEEIQKGA